MPRNQHPLKNNYERAVSRRHDLPNDAPHQAVLEASTAKTQASPLEKVAIGVAALSLAVSMSVFGVPGEMPHPAPAVHEQL